LGALIVGIVIGLRVATGSSLVLFLAGAIGGALYNEVVRRLPLWKGVMTAALCGLIVFFDVVAFDLPIRFLWIGCTCVVFVAGRELLMDVKDRGGDAKVGMETIAVRWGDARVAVLGFVLLAVSLLPLTAFVAFGGGGLTQWSVLGAYGVVIGIAFLVWFRAPWVRRRWIAVEVLKAAMLTGIAVMIVA
jgi:4-hydroxybenzoate polyprenyltransferase